VDTKSQDCRSWLFATPVFGTKFAEYGKELKGGQGVSLEEGILRAEILEKYQNMFSEEHVEACLIEVQIFAGGVALKPKRMRVRIADVSAWGMGSETEGLARRLGASRA